MEEIYLFVVTITGFITCTLVQNLPNGLSFGFKTLFITLIIMLIPPYYTNIFIMTVYVLWMIYYVYSRKDEYKYLRVECVKIPKHIKKEMGLIY